MATTSLSLDPHWDTFIRSQVESGRFESAREVVEAALREFEKREGAYQALREHVLEGIRQADRGEFVEPRSVEQIMADAKHRAAKRT